MFADVAAPIREVGSKFYGPLAVAKPIEAVREETIVDIGRLPLDGADVGLAAVWVSPLRSTLIEDERAGRALIDGRACVAQLVCTGGTAVVGERIKLRAGGRDNDPGRH